MAMGPGKWWRCAVRRAAAGCVRALADLGVMFGVVTENHLAAGREPQPAGVSLDEPPADHPERLPRGVPLSARERELWAQLDGIDKRA
ncbi:DUF6059 family protein [Streptomyces sp. NPDC059118]|uniref:DUF6059 family protein n=1 Tax=unclassified Streptomyces TaxID=2593676 RepID=UPI0036AE870D